jgi:hypothetical protein
MNRNNTGRANEADLANDMSITKAGGPIYIMSHGAALGRLDNVVGNQDFLPGAKGELRTAIVRPNGFRARTDGSAAPRPERQCWPPSRSLVNTC